MNLSQLNILSEKFLYKKRRTKSDFKEQLRDEDVSEELSMEEVLNLNKVRNRYSKKEIEDFIEDRWKTESWKLTKTRRSMRSLRNRSWPMIIPTRQKAGSGKSGA